MATNQQKQSQTTDDISDNLVKIVDKNGNFYGTGFFIDVDSQIYCITCHHCICELDEIFIERFEIKYKAKWTEEYSEMKQDLAVLNVEDSQQKPLIYAKEAMASFPVTIRGFSGEKIKNLPQGTSGRESSLSDTFTPFVVKESGDKGNNKWNKKPAVYVNVYECEGKYDFGFSGSPVCYKGPNKVVGIFTAKDNNFGYVIPIQTLLDKFRLDKSNAIQSTKNLNVHGNIDISGVLETGNTLLNNNEFESAIQKYDEILNQESFQFIIFNKAYALGQLRKHEEAIKWYDIYLKINPNDVDALNNKGSSLSELFRYRDALNYYEMALQINSNYLNAILSKGYALFSLGEYEESINWYKRALEIDANDVITLGNIGLSYSELGNQQEALKWLDKALEIDPNHVINLSMKALALSREGKEGVEKLSSMVLGIDPKDQIALNNLGLAHHNLGNYQEAITLYDTALEIDPNNPTTLNNKGWALYGMKKIEESIVWYDKSLDLDPEYSLPMINKGASLDEMGRYEEAIEWYDKALGINPNFIDALNNKGWAFYKLGRYKEAIECYDKALRIDPDFTFALENKQLAERTQKEAN